MFVRSFEFTDEAEVCLTGAADMDYGAEYHTRERRGAPAAPGGKQAATGCCRLWRAWA